MAKMEIAKTPREHAAKLQEFGGQVLVLVVANGGCKKVTYHIASRLM